MTSQLFRPRVLLSSLVHLADSLFQRTPPSAALSLSWESRCSSHHLILLENGGHRVSLGAQGSLGTHVAKPPVQYTLNLFQKASGAPQGSQLLATPSSAPIWHPDLEGG
jgi:hypothetical protein